MNCLRALFLCVCAAFFLNACTTSAEPEEILPESGSGGYGGKSSSREPSSSSDAGNIDEWSDIDDAVFGIEWSLIPATVLKKGNVSYSVDDFMMMSTEMTQGLYGMLMGNLPEQKVAGDDYPVVNVSWYQAVLFCNELSKQMGLDTAYVYRFIGEKNVLDGLTIDYSVKSVRLPTEIEWEVAARGGTTTTYYWGTDIATKYAYYGQSKGPAEVAGYESNEYSLYDMAGNVAEWVNDWFGSYPTKSVENYAGPASGTYRVVRGGGWSDPVKECAPDIRDKKDPLYSSISLGFRVVRTLGKP